MDVLLADAFFDRLLEDVAVAPTPETRDPVARVLQAETAVNDVIFANEVGVYVMTKLYAEYWLSGEESNRPLRPSRRLAFIDEAIAPLADRLGAAATRRLRHALALALGTEAVIALTNVCGLSTDQAREVTRWTVAALVQQALAEA